MTQDKKPKGKEGIHSQSKYNLHSKSKDFFPIRQYRFDSSKHPIITSRKECRFRVKTILSKQEEQMLDGLINTLQCNQRDALRIIFYEAVRRGYDLVEPYSIYAKRDSKERGHTSRSIKLTTALPGSEKQGLLELASELDLSEKEIFRLSIIWLEKSIRNGSIYRIHKCRLISNDDLGRAWSRENRGKPKNPRVAALKEARDIEKRLRILFDEEEATLPIHNSYFYPLWRLISYNSTRINQILEDYGLFLNALSSWDKEILANMIMFECSWKEAVDDHYADRREAERIMHLGRKELLELIEKERIDRIDSKHEYQEKLNQQREGALSRTIEDIKTDEANEDRKLQKQIKRFVDEQIKEPVQEVKRLPEGEMEQMCEEFLESLIYRPADLEEVDEEADENEYF